MLETLALYSRLSHFCMKPLLSEDKIKFSSDDISLASRILEKVFGKKLFPFDIKEIATSNKN